MFKVNNKDTRTTLQCSHHIETSQLICSANQLTGFYMMGTLERRSGVFIVNFEHISHLVLVFLLLTLNMQLPAGWEHLYILLFTYSKVLYFKLNYHSEYHSVSIQENTDQKKLRFWFLFTHCFVIAL